MYHALTKLICKRSVAALAFFWLLGILFGFYLAFRNCVTVATLLRSVLLNDTNLIYRLLAAYIPYFLIIVLRKFGVWVLFIKGIAVGFCVCGFSFGFASAGWLLCLLYLFPDILVLQFVFCVYFSEHFFHYQTDKLSIALYVFLSLIAASIDLCFVSPFVKILINRF